MINIKGNEANKYVLLALRTLGVNAKEIIIKETDNNVKCFLMYNKTINGIMVDKLISIHPKNYLRLLSYGINQCSKGDKVNGLCLCRKNS